MYAIWLALFVASCTYEFDVNGVGTDEKLVLYCLPGAGSDTTFIQLSRSLPVSGKGQLQEVERDARVSFRVNGEEQPVCWNEVATPSLPMPGYYVVGRWNEGDEVRIRAEAGGVPPVEAQTYVPAAFPLQRMERVLIQDSPVMQQFRITFRDRMDTEDYYGVRIEATDSVRTLGWYEVEADSYVMEIFVDNEPLLNGNTGLNGVFNLSSESYQGIYLWDDHRVSGREYTLRLNVYYYADSDEELTGAFRRYYYLSLIHI